MRNSASLAAVLFAVSVGLSGHALADDDSCGAQTAVNNAITSADSWDTLVSCSVTLDVAHAHNCVVNACADAGGAVVGTNNDYRFVVSTAPGGPGLDSAWERSVSSTTRHHAHDSIPFATAVTVSAAYSSVTALLLARKVAAAGGDMTAPISR